MAYLKKINVKYYLQFAALVFLIGGGCEKSVFVEPFGDFQPVETTKIFVNSNPAGAAIYIDGRTTGLLTPDTVKWLKEGDCMVTLKKNLFWDTSFVVRTELGNKKEVFIDYSLSERMLGNIQCITNPKGAKIYLDNVYTGKITPAILTKLVPKVYSVKFDYPEYRKDSVLITLKSMSTEYATSVMDDTLDVVKYATVNSELPSDYITGVAEDKQGNIWAGTQNEGLVKFDGKKFYRYTTGNSSFMKSNYIFRVKSDNAGNIWVGFSNALSRYDGSQWQSIPTNAITLIQVLPDNSILAVNDRAGIIKYSNGSFQSITNGNGGLPDNNVVSMCYDNTGKLWAAFRNGGIGIYDGTGWTMQDSTLNKMPYYFCCGLNLSKDGKILGMFYKRPNGPAPSAEHSMAFFQNGEWKKIFDNLSAWIEDKDLYIDQKNRTWYSYNSPYPLVARVRNDDLGREYFYNNILKSGIRKFRTWLYDNILMFFYGGQAFVDSKGNLWIFGDRGMIKLKAGRWNN